MLSGVYDYFFGEENSNDSSVCSQENVEPCSVSSSEEDWCIVEDSASGRSSPVVVAEPEVRDIDSLSFCSKKSFKPITAEQIMRSEELRAARAAAAQRMELERALFSETDVPLAPSRTNGLQRSVLVSASKLKRSTAATLVANDSKTKSRSKKAVKTPANRNNDRKCQNLD